MSEFYHIFRSRIEEKSEMGNKTLKVVIFYVNLRSIDISQIEEYY